MGATCPSHASHPYLKDRDTKVQKGTDLGPAHTAVCDGKATPKTQVPDAQPSGLARVPSEVLHEGVGGEGVASNLWRKPVGQSQIRVTPPSPASPTAVSGG